MRHRAAALVSSILAIAAGALVLPAPASAVVDGIGLEITRLPRTFSAGAAPSTITVVASADAGQRCQKVRWSMTLQLDGVRPDQVRVQRIEADADFPLRVETGANSARLTDVRLDPGRLCTGQTVTANYEMAFTGDADGRVTFQPEALDAAGRLLQTASSTSRVAGAPDAKPSPTESSSPSREATPEPTATESDPAAVVTTDAPDDQQSDAAAAPAQTTPDDLSANPAANADNVPSLLGPGLIVGAIMVFLGVGLLLRLRMRNRAPKGRQQHQMPTGFYPTQ